MFSLAPLRTTLARTAFTRGLGLLLVLAVVAAGLPRWEVHAHAAADHGHTHGGVLAEHDEPAPAAGDDAGNVIPHLHDAASVSAALQTVDPLRLAGLPPVGWTPSFLPATAAAAAGPPPHRPPIV